MTKLTLSQYNTKLSCFACCLANKSLTLLNKLNMGIACTEEFKKFKYYSLLLEIMRCYTIDDSLTIDEQDCENSFDYSYLVSRIEDFEIYCGIC